MIIQHLCLCLLRLFVFSGQLKHFFINFYVFKALLREGCRGAAVGPRNKFLMICVVKLKKHVEVTNEPRDSSCCSNCLKTLRLTPQVRSFCCRHRRKVLQLKLSSSVFWSCSIYFYCAWMLISVISFTLDFPQALYCLSLEDLKLLCNLHDTAPLSSRELYINKLSHVPHRWYQCTPPLSIFTRGGDVPAHDSSSQLVKKCASESRFKSLPGPINLQESAGVTLERGKEEELEVRVTCKHQPLPRFHSFLYFQGETLHVYLTPPEQQKKHLYDIIIPTDIIA